MVVQDAQEQDDSRRMFKGKKSYKKGLNEMVGINLCSKGEFDQVDWRESIVVDMIVKTNPPLGGGSTFLTKR
jgi:hypothetical protein